MKILNSTNNNIICNIALSAYQHELYKYIFGRFVIHFFGKEKIL